MRFVPHRILRGLRGLRGLLQGIVDTGSIAAAGRRLNMSYKRAWQLVETLNTDFGAPLVHAVRGGNHGGRWIDAAGRAGAGGVAVAGRCRRPRCQGSTCQTCRLARGRRNARRLSPTKPGTSSPGSTLSSGRRPAPASRASAGSSPPRESGRATTRAAQRRIPLRLHGHTDAAVFIAQLRCQGQGSPGTKPGAGRDRLHAHDPRVRRSGVLMPVSPASPSL